ncbi:MAG: DUF6134 family protein [Ginsengibacter sp.]
MKTFQNNRKSIDDPVACVIIYLLIIGLFLLGAKLMHYYQWHIVYGVLFILGWFSWTFFEYMLHRFIWHSKATNKRDSGNDTFNHSYHHTHPTEIKMTKLKRLLLVAGSIILILFSIWIHNYFTVLVGVVCGFTIYNLMHLLLHKKFTQKIFAKHVQYHIYHHCKYPDKCFGISVTWWDDLFGTVPQEKNIISKKVTNFYFGEKINKPVAVSKKELFILMMLLSFYFYSPAQERKLQYDVTRNGNVIGYLNVTEKTKGNIVFLELKSEVKTRLLLFSYSSKVIEDVIFEDGMMIFSFYYRKENGKQTSVEARKTDGNFIVTENGRKSLQHYKPVLNNILQLYCNSPGMDTKKYSNISQQFLDIKRVAENRYRLTLPDGNYNYYNYKNGKCTQVDVERTLFTIHFVLRN